MTKHSEATLIALLLAGCVGGIFFVFAMLTEEGGAFDTEEKPPARHRVTHPVPIERIEAASPDPGPAVDPDNVVIDTPPPDRVETVEPEITGTEDAADEEEVERGEGEIAQLTIEMVRPAEEGERDIAVRVVDGSGAPVDDVLVAFREGPFLVFRARTGPEGRVLFEPYPTERGPFRIDAVAHGYDTASSTAVMPGAETELVLNARAAITGRVRAPAQGQGLVRLYTAHGQVETKIESDGSFVFEDLDEGHMTVEAVVRPYGTKQIEFFLPAGVTRDVVLRVRNTKRIPIRGNVRFWPREGRGKMTINGIDVPVTATGNFTFKEAVEGLNEVFIDAPERALYRERFNVRATAKSTAIRFRLLAESKIFGHVSESRRRNRVEGAEVRVGIDTLDRRNEAGVPFPIEAVPVVKTDRDGKYAIRRLDGRFVYQVAVLKQGYGLYYHNAIPSTSTTLNPVLPQGPFLFGKLRGYGGVPRDARVTALPLESTSERLRFNVADWNISKSGRDRKGFFGLSGLLPGSYLVKVDAPGFGSLETVIDLRDGERARVDLRLRRKGDLAADEDAELLERLPPVIASTGEEDLPAPADATILRIQAAAKEGQVAFGGIRILFFEDEAEFAPPMEFFEDSFEIVGLPEADYRAVLTHPSLKKPLVKDSIKLRRAAPIEIDLR